MKICPRCYSEVPDDQSNCQNCGFKMVKIEPPKAASRPSREEVKTPSAPKKKKAKKSDILILVGVLGAFVLLMVMVSMPAPTVSSPPGIGGGVRKIAGTTQSGGSGGLGGAGASQTAKPVATSGMAGAPYVVDSDGTVYFSLRRENIEAVLAKEDVQPLIDEKELLILQNGTNVTLISVSEELAFVDIMDGEHEGGVGYVVRDTLKPRE